MKVYASSFRFCNRPNLLRELFGSSVNVAVISNALDFSEDVVWRRGWLKRELEELSEIGLHPEELDLRDFFSPTTSSAHDRLMDFDGVWVIGGNAFILRRAMRYSGFDQFIWNQQLRDPEFVYGGYSAGACVLAPSLRGLDLVDPPNQFPKGYQAQTIWEGLGVLSYSIAPHFDSNHPESARIDKVIDYFEHHKMPYRALRDGDSIVVDE